MIYEVNIQVDEAIADEYAQWLAEHMEQMLEFDGFCDARLYRTEGPPNYRALTVHYHLSDRSALDSYLQLHAPAMRAQATQRFGERFTATRRVLEPV